MAKTKTKKATGKSKTLPNPWSGEVIASNIRKNAEQISENIQKNAELISNNVASNSKAVGDKITAVQGYAIISAGGKNRRSRGCVLEISRCCRSGTCTLQNQSFSSSNGIVINNPI